MGGFSSRSVAAFVHAEGAARTERRPRRQRPVRAEAGNRERDAGVPRIGAGEPHEPRAPFRELTSRVNAKAAGSSRQEAALPVMI